MKRFIFSLVFSAIIFAVSSTTGFAQGSTFNDKNVEYSFDLPEVTWKMTVKPSVSNPIVEYVYRDRSDGHLEIQKINVEANALLGDIIAEQEQKLKFKPGFIAGKNENFAGNYRGTVYNFEYVKSGRNMSGRLYFLRANETTVYVLKFTGMRDELKVIRNQTDSIARTFKLSA